MIVLSNAIRDSLRKYMRNLVLNSENGFRRDFVTYIRSCHRQRHMKNPVKHLGGSFIQK